MKKLLPLFILIASAAHLTAQTPVDPLQPAITGDIVARVDAVKEKQVDGKDLDAAEKELQDIIKTKPDYYRAIYNLGLVYQSQGRNKEALATLDQANQLRLKANIADNSILNSIGWTKMSMGELDAAEKLFKEALAKEKENKPATNQRILNNLGYLFLQKGQPQQARQYLDRSVKDFNSSGAKRVLNLVDEYERNKANKK